MSTFSISTLGSATDKFFAPLTDLKADGAKIYMGTIHHLHGPQGMKGQIDTIRKYISDFGLSSPCGWGRVPMRPGRIATDSGDTVANAVDVMVKDHLAALEFLGKAAR